MALLRHQQRASNTVKWALVACIIALATPVPAQDIRSNVQAAYGVASVSPIIDLNQKTLFGIPVGTSEDEVIKLFGPATGYIRINGSQTLMLYGKSVGLVFDGGKLSGLRLSDHLVDWRISNDMENYTPFNRVEWRMNNGIRKNMSMAEVRRILGDRLQEDRSKDNFSENGFQISLDVVRFHIDGMGKSADQRGERVGGIYIR